ncbi:hypothetical protein BTHERMOSOX_574 [Bathymodiolus thermophilus thioautotrophic gill symbiont]|uniref:Uncharacterized protein n=1 Tax=Bathymodiolus thermophilus thioautotrophic gill symbiont TaxID=2360 RepID=A0A8H9CGE1_9GAMM|nr:hypothetical protein [Bathymodiolus thermophilus thioautotrophic gill symbiont]CAB5498051.1 hypothetical protein THERMOS_775 [Bathymodiolus thermophilus thioautotrophic gill symbiont]SGZ71896.1 hypothetical protein BTHERMOSOX_574 [Bathymodiolus thermophilus thioautotrophic gill symbiont]
MDDWQNSIFTHLVIFLNLVLAGLRLGLKNYQVGDKWILDDYLCLCKSLIMLLSIENDTKRHHIKTHRCLNCIEIFLAYK